jgi:flagellum-specific peptidoglycan hydrolase FlgJ
MATIHSKNTPKAGYTGNNSVYPAGAFKVETMKLIGVGDDGSDVEKDIRNIAESFTITTELFSPVVTFSATLRDNEDLFSSEKFRLGGQERIELKIRALGIAADAITHTFYVKEYPTLTRTLDFPNTQIYTLLAISEFAYRSNLMNICRVLDDGKDLYDNIKTIFVDDLGLTDLVKYGEVATKFKGIINIQKPLQAADWLRSRAFEENGAPFFLYSDLMRPKEVFFKSWKVIAQDASPIVSKFAFKAFNTETPGTQEYSDAERSRILHMSSNFKYDRLGAANAGAYSCRISVTDYAAKNYYTLDLKSDNTTNDWNPRKYTIKNRDGNNENSILPNIPSSKTISTQINTAISDPDFVNGANNGTVFNSITSTYRYVPYANALYARLNETNHEILVYGDPILQPGVKINLKVPKPSLDSKSDSKTTNTKSDSNLDPVASGDYIVLVSSFIFSDGVFKNKLKLAKLVPAITGDLFNSEPDDGPLGGTGAATAAASGSTGTATPFTGDQKAYYDKVYNAIHQAAVAKGLENPEVIARLGAAQSALETGWGTSLPPGSNNYFGIKGTGPAGSVNSGTREVFGGKSVWIKDNFKAYNDFNESAAGYVDFLVQNPRYKDVLASTNIDSAVVAIGKSGYATAPDYAAKVGSIAKKY